MSFSLSNALKQTIGRPQPKARPASTAPIKVAPVVPQPRLQVALPGGNSFRQASPEVAQQQAAYNPGAIPLQDNNPLRFNQAPQAAPFTNAPQVQKPFNQQQRQLGVKRYNLNALAGDFNPALANKNFMVNVPWSSQQVAYRDSLRYPRNFKPKSGPTREKVDTSYLPEPKPMLGAN